MHLHLALPVALFVVLPLALGHCAGALNSRPRPVPQMQVIPLPNSEVSFQRDGVELTRYHFASSHPRPFLFPLNGPSGRSLTRMGHPHDPVSHSHHNSVWISHHEVDGLSSWDDSGKMRIVHQRIEEFSDADASASVVAVNHWVTESREVRVIERRRLTVHALPKNEWLLVIDLHLTSRDASVTLGKTPFGLIGVRVAKTLGVNDGGGTLRNSEGGHNEKEVFWKPARWVDYSGPITARAVEGITLMDHPGNPGHPAVFHVRDDGWMGASVTFDTPRALAPTKPLILRYGLYVHSGQPSMKVLQQRWGEFARFATRAWPAARK